LGTQKKYTFPELACTDLPKSEEGESFTLQQKKVLICAAFFTVCVIVLFQIMNAENHDCKNRVAQSEKQIEVLKKQLEGLSQPSTSVPSTSSAPSAGEWKRPANSQFSFGCIKKVEKTICFLDPKNTTCILTCMIVLPLYFFNLTLISLHLFLLKNNRKQQVLLRFAPSCKKHEPCIPSWSLFYVPLKDNPFTQ